LLDKEALVLILVTVCAQELPVAAIGRVIVVVMVAMMDFQQLQVGVSEVAATAPTYPGIDLECLFAVARRALFACPPRVGDDTIEASVIGPGLSFGHGCLLRIALAEATTLETIALPRA
jgi:hypothetical protein